MSLTSDIIAKLTAAAIAPSGGIFDYDDTGILGITRASTPTAYDSNLVIQPCILVKLRSSVPTNDLVGSAPSEVNMIEVWFYEANGYTNIRSLMASVFAALHEQQVTGNNQILWALDIPQGYDQEAHANVGRSDYSIFGTK